MNYFPGYRSLTLPYFELEAEGCPKRHGKQTNFAGTTQGGVGWGMGTGMTWESLAGFGIVELSLITSTTSLLAGSMARKDC